MKFVLQILDKPTGQWSDLHSVDGVPDRPVVLGRGTQVSIQVVDERLSRRHCQFEFMGSTCFVVDLRSANGSYLNQVRIQRARICHGDVVDIGNTQLRVLLVREGQPKKVGPADRAMSCASCGNVLTPDEVPTVLDPNRPPITFCSACQGHLRLVGNAVAGHTLLEFLRVGATGPVYRAKKGGEDEVTLKLLRAEQAPAGKLALPASKLALPVAMTRFEREAVLGGQVEHPNVVRVLAHGKEGKHCWLVTELVTGHTLAEILRAAGFLPAEEVVDLGVQVSDALAYLHGKGIFHRDVSPWNVFREPRGGVKLANFGLATAAGVAGAPRITSSTVGPETLAYMAPEVLLGATEADARTDLYALGATLYHAAVGQLPFSPFPLDAFLRQAMHDRPVFPAEPIVPGALQQAILRLLEKSPDARPKDAAEAKALIGAAGTSSF